MNLYTNKQKIVSLIIASFIFFQFCINGYIQCYKIKFLLRKFSRFNPQQFHVICSTKALMKQIKE